MLTLEEAAELWEARGKAWAMAARWQTQIRYPESTCYEQAAKYAGFAREYRDAHAKGVFEG